MLNIRAILGEVQVEVVCGNHGRLGKGTAEHPFFISAGRRVAGRDLWLGALVRKADGTYGTVDAIEVPRRPQAMYNLTVAEAYTCFVGDGSGWCIMSAAGILKMDQP